VREDYRIPAERVVPAGAGANYLAEPLPHGPYDTQTVLFVGIDFERKGGPLVVEAFRLVREKHPKARLVIVGCDPGLDEPGIEIAGRITKDAPGGKERLLKLYSEASVFCMMSHFEPFGIVVIEAQNSYVPCVLPNQFAFPEMIRDNETGRLINKYDAGRLAEVLGGLLSSPAKLEKMGKAAHDFVHAQWTWDLAAERIHTRILKDLHAGT
jgi:glycosyltransferase involved in cell wall biosynthesis